MTVAFDGMREFLDDLRAEAAAEQVDDKLVRVSIEKAKPNQTTTRVTLTAGFSALGELRQLTIDCGEEFARQRTDASDAANHAVDEIKKACIDLNLAVRGGRFEE